MLRFLYLLVLPILLNSQVTITAPETFLSGEAVIFSINAKGSSVQFPVIDKIEGFIVQQAGTSNQTTIINGKKDQSIIRKYMFYPTINITIPSFKIKINGKIEQTKSKKIILKKVTKTTSDNFDITIKVNKKDVYVGEEILLTMTFKYKKNIQLYDLQFVTPTFENFWSKQINTNRKPKDNLYVVQEINYLLFPQKDGILEIPTLQIDAILPDSRMQNNFFGNATKTKRIYSNSLKINAKALPQDVYLIGDFKIKSTIDKLSIKQGEAVSYKLEISGRGNIDDIEEFKLDMPNTTIYDNPSQKDFNIQNGRYGGVYKKSYSIVANKDFKIPVLNLKYFDIKTKKVKIIQTKEYNIKVAGIAPVKQKLEIKQENIKPVENNIQTKVIEKVVVVSTNDKIIFFILGFVLASVLFLLYSFFRNKEKTIEDFTLEKNIKKCSTQNELLKKVVPFINIDENLDRLIYTLEENNDIKLKQIKKELIVIVKELKL